MALLRAAALPAEGSPAWLPTHVQVTVVRARGLRCKSGGKAGTSDAYTIIQLGRERYSTSVAEKSTGSPEWREECAFELPAEPAACPGLLLTVMHRALVGMDRFLGQALVPLEPALQQGRAPDERWHKLHSKAGKKEKERGEILVCIQFTRHNITASMFDLSMKDKPRSPFGKLKDKVKGKKKYDLESASAIIPSSMGGLDVEDDYDIGGKKSKVKGFFLKNKLRKSSLTQSNTSLGSDSTISSASLGLASNVPEVSRSPSRHSSVSMERSVKDLLPSPKPTHKRAFSDDVSQVSPVLEPKAIQSLKPKNDPVSRSSLCINGSHVYSDEPAPKSPACVPQSSGVPKQHQEGSGFAPVHAEPQEVPWGVSSFERTQQRDEPRFIPSPPSLALQEELRVSTKAVTLSNHLGRARMEESSRMENKPTQAAAPMVFSTDTAKDKQAEDTKKEEKRAKGGLFHHGGNKNDTGSKGQGEKVGSSHGSSIIHTGGDERSKSSSWFGSKESPQKPSFPAGPRAAPEVAGSFYSSEDSSPSASLRHKDPERESPAPSVGVPVPETTPPSQGALPPPPDKVPAVPPPLSEWDETFDAFATSRLKPELKKENFFASVAAEGMAFIDDPGAVSPTERSVEAPQEKGTKVFEKAEAQISTEIPAALRAWTNFSGLDVGANLVSTTQEATVIEDVLSPVAVGSMGRRRKSSTPTVWTTTFASGNPGEKEASTALSAPSSVREEGDSNEEDPSSAGTNGWMTIATETSPDPSESSQSGAGQESTFSSRPAFLSEGTFEAKSSSRAARLLPSSTFSPEPPSQPLPGSNVVAVPPRVLPDVAPRRFPVVPEPGMEPPGAGGEEDAFDIRTSVYRLQASMRLEASDSRVRLGSDARDVQVVLSPWPGSQEKEMVASSTAPPPKPPRWFAAVGGGGDGEEEDACNPQRGGEEQREEAEGPKAEVELPRSCVSSEPSGPASPTVGVDVAGSKFPVSKDGESAPVDSAAHLEVRAHELAEGAASLREEPSEVNETHAAEHFETCPSEFSLDGLGQSGLSPLMGTEWGTASNQEPFPEDLSTSRLNPPSKLDLAQQETFWTALEEQEASGHPVGLSSAPRPQRLAHGESPPQPEPVQGDGEGQQELVAGPMGPAGGRAEPMAVAVPPREAEQGSPTSSEPGIDFKKADFWKAAGAEERHKEDASTPRNPFAPALSPNPPTNPFVEKPPEPVPVQAVLPKRFAQGGSSFSSLQEEALGPGFPTHLPGDALGQPFLHDHQPLAFSTPFLVAATNPEQFDFPCPCPAATSRAAAQPCPMPQPGDTQASALLVLPRETQPAEKPLFQQISSPHPVKPISAAVQEGPSEKKQQHRSSLTAALSNGLEKLKTATTSSVQPVAPSSHSEKADSKQLKDPTVLDQAAKYYHLTHDELIELLLQKEKELSKKEEHIHELENYIDQLLVRIMEQSPTLLQIPLGENKTK
ncbi:rab11 family-interacting protein 5 [Neopsephotus bourkii]|uniref:rab11 family-interacting protein 5 n=1 Tax=Neopsephotus bourkii TaxID=309878 RepID=UPI002AA598C4|nr:rab11 family-interacting protein 5 [Neopsephotus bourkii]